MSGNTAGVVFVAILAAAAGGQVKAADLRQPTVAAFDRYVRAAEDRLVGGSFLWVDGLPEPRRSEVRGLIRRGELNVERLSAPGDRREPEVPNGLVHHWVGTAFVRGATLEQALSLLQNYDEHQRVYAPAVTASRLLERDGDRFRIFLRFTMHRVVTVVVNSEHEARFRQPAPRRAEGWIRSTRIAEVESAGQPGEREKPVGRDAGYLWRLNTYWRLLADDGGLYIQCESISLTRGIPTGLGWLVGPFVTSIPRESLIFTLDTTRRQLGGGV